MAKHNFVNGQTLYAQPLNEMEDDIANKMTKHLLSYDGTNILENGTIKTYSNIYNMLMNDQAFVIVVYNDRAFHPNRITSEQIVFISSYVSNSQEIMERISINHSNLVTFTSGTSETSVNKTNVINDTNKDSESKYPSIKAVVDYASSKEETDTIKESLNELSEAIEYEKGTTNLFDPSTNLANLWANTSRGTFVADNNCVSFIIELKGEGTITIDKGAITNGNRFIYAFSEAFPSAGVLYNSSTTETATTTQKKTLNISNNDKYLLFMINSVNADIDKSIIKVFYGTEWSGDTSTKIDRVEDDLKGLFPSIIGNEKLVNLLSYRPLGALSKGYICLSSDDGAVQLATHTIPLLKSYKTQYNENIPMTFGLMTTSHVLNNASEIELVKEMINDYGCEVAIHGSASYTTYSDSELVNFLDVQANRIQAICEVAPKSIIYPNHAYNTKSSTIAGSYYGVCATGGTNTPIMYDSCAGARSNLYTLYRYSLFGKKPTLQDKKNDIKAKIDETLANHYVFLPFFHDVDLAVDDPNYWTASECAELINYCVSYAKSVGLTFCTLGEIPSLI